MNLLIVESPAKAKTIEKILGKEFKVKSSFGHIRELSKVNMGIDIQNNFKPTYEISKDKLKVVKELKDELKKCDEVWLATDEDREGEAISWHLCEVLGLNIQKTKRIVFHEITSKAIQSAVKNPRSVNIDLVNAQQARRILDRIVGFEISPVLWRRVGANLSAGRVQSVAVKLIVEREQEINGFTTQSNFKVDAYLIAPDSEKRPLQFKAELNDKFTKNEEAKVFLASCTHASYQVVDVQTKPTKKSPTAPFTTSTLQQEASRKLGYSVTRTMSVAQKLYENGHISYMRTDSVSLSETAIENIKDAVTNKYGASYFQRRKYANKNESAQEAHEAIRPTDMHTEDVGDSDGQRLYELIWKRTMASQMADAEIDRTIAKIEVSTNKALLTASGEVITFYGFLKAYQESTDEEEDDKDANTSNLPPLKIGQQVDFKEMRAMQRFSRPPARYTEAALVKKLEELGIGRPSTYAPTIKTIVDRAYVEKGTQESVVRNFEQLILKNNQIQESVEKENTGGNKGKLVPTDLGLVVTQFLSEGFDKIMDYNFTAKIEQEFDEIAIGKLEWEEMLRQFYKPFHATVEDSMAQQGRVTGERELGVDPKSGKPVIARLGRYGAMVQMGIADEEEKLQFASLNPNQSIQTITLQEALDLFKLPMHVGKKEDIDVIVHSGRFGPYISWGELKVSLPKGLDPLTVDFSKALQLISEKQAADAPIATFDSKPVTKGSGRFGPFIKWNDMFINVPRRFDFEHLSKADIDTLINAKIEKESKRYIQHWESEKIAIENGRWGPFIRFGKQMIKLDRAANGEKQTEALLQALSLEDVKKMIEEKIPNAFTKKASAKKAVAKKTSTKKTATKKAVAKKSTAAKK